MPPSGFNSHQAHHISSFLEKCLEALIHEAQELQLTFPAALKREVQNIEQINAKEPTGFQFHLLEMIKVFYQQLISKHPLSEAAIRREGIKASQQFQRLILAIHVPSVDGLYASNSLKKSG